MANGYVAGHIVHLHVSQLWGRSIKFSWDP